MKSARLMHYLTRSRQILLATLILACVLPLFTSCEPTILFRVENQYHGSITVFINEKELGSIQATEPKTFSTLLIPFRPDVPEAPKDYLIEAKTGKGEVIYSKRFTWQELHDMGWQIVISPLGKGTESSDNVTGESFAHP